MNKPNLHRDRHILASTSPPDHVVMSHEEQDGFASLSHRQQQRLHNFRQVLAIYSGRQIPKLGVDVDDLNNRNR